MSAVPPAGWSLQRVAAFVDGLALEEVRTEISAGYFLRRMRQGTRAGPYDDTLMPLPEHGDNPALGSALTDYHVHPLRQHGNKRFGGEYIAVGRGGENDVVIEDVSVSKLHAFVVQDKGVFTLADAGSRFGTFIDDHLLRSYRHEPPHVLKDGDRVRFGDVHTIFVLAPALLQLCKRV